MQSKELEDIKRHLYLAGELHKTAQFDCFTDGVAVFTVDKKEGITELCFIVENSSFLNEEKVIDIISQKDLLYLSHAEYTEDGDIYYKSIDYVNPRCELIDDDDEDEELF
tara:strand:- start:41 stop:370 length:330 start_codon:yes stop_codon:yes gene_type:complete